MIVVHLDNAAITCLSLGDDGEVGQAGRVLPGVGGEGHSLQVEEVDKEEGNNHLDNLLLHGLRCLGETVTERRDAREAAPLTV